MFGRDHGAWERERLACLTGAPHAGGAGPRPALPGGQARRNGMRGHDGRRGLRAVAALGLLLAAWLGPVACAQAQEHAAREPRASGRVGSLPGYQPAAPLGFRLVDTRVDEQVYRRADGAGEGLVWSASFTSRWALSADQLDRW